MAREQRAASLRIAVIALTGGAFAGLVSAAFIWIVEEGVHLMWVELPDRLDLDPYDSWWMFAVPIVGGVIVGLGQKFIGNLPLPIAEVVSLFRSGSGVEPNLVPGAFFLAVVALIFGGSVGFEAALSCIIGGFATGIARQLGPREADARSAWGLGHTADVPERVRSAAGWLAALAGIFTFIWLPFGDIDLSGRLGRFDGVPDVGDGLLVVVFAVLAATPVAWAFNAVVMAEHATLYRINPILIGAAGGLVLGILASAHPLVFFSGQQGINELGDLSAGDLAYVTVAKWGALAIMLLAGWRGGPIFPLWLSVASLAVLVLDPFGVPVGVATVAGVTIVSAVFLRGRVLPAVVLTLYAVRASYAGVMLLAAAGVALGLLIAGALGALPRTADDDFQVVSDTT